MCVPISAWKGASVEPGSWDDYAEPELMNLLAYRTPAYLFLRAREGASSQLGLVAYLFLRMATQRRVPISALCAAIWQSRAGPEREVDCVPVSACESRSHTGIRKEGRGIPASPDREEMGKSGRGSGACRGRA